MLSNRGARFRQAVVLCLVWIAAAGVALAAPGVLSVGTTVADLDRAVAFYADVLGFREIDRRETWGRPLEELTGVFGARALAATMRLGDETFVLTQYLTPRGRAVPEDARSNDRTFQHIAIVVRDIDAAYARLRERGVRHVSTAPQTLPDWNPAAGGIRAFYFQDPDGHNLEIIWFPPGKGDPRWRRPADALFLGIDHTAIVVSDTDRSLSLYRDLLGLRVAGTSENWGEEQEHLNLVFGARLRITALRGASGPGIEFLEYLSPSNGRPAPADLAPSDLLHWEVTLSGIDPQTSWSRVTETGGRRVSSGAIELTGPPEPHTASMLRDPDGHALVLVEP